MDNGPASYAEEPKGARARWALIGFLAIATFFLFTEHRAHLLGILPYLLALACPLMHLFHHGHHRKNAGPSGRGDHGDASPDTGEKT